MNHSFNIELATKYGIEEAIIIENLAFWINKNKANKKHIINGQYWTYNSSKALKELFPYISEKKIQRILKKLEQLKIIKSGNFNKSAYDRTKWYTIIDKSIVQIYTIHLPKLSNGKDTSVQPIPDINTDINTYIKNNKDFLKKEKKPYFMGKLMTKDLQWVIWGKNDLRTFAGDKKDIKWK